MSSHLISSSSKCFGNGNNLLFDEQDVLEKDTQAFMYGRVVNKHARHNLCFSEEQQEPNYEEGKGRVYAFNEVPLLKKKKVKTAKPILARRLFILLGNRHSLARLQDLGFKTFSGIIDESYDSIESHTERHGAALEQLLWLCKQDQTHILSQCRAIVDHNFNLYKNKTNLF